MLVAYDEYPDSCTDTADIGSYDSTIGSYTLAYTSTNAADSRTYPRANSCTQPVSDKPAHSSTYNSQVRYPAAVSAQAVERKQCDRHVELS